MLPPTARPDHAELPRAGSRGAGFSKHLTQMLILTRALFGRSERPRKATKSSERATSSSTSPLPQRRIHLRAPTEHSPRDGAGQPSIPSSFSHHQGGRRACSSPTGAGVNTPKNSPNPIPFLLPPSISAAPPLPICETPACLVRAFSGRDSAMSKDEVLNIQAPGTGKKSHPAK